jgi:exopolyphosphatase/pppGpp-phosphohydrolase
METVRIGLIEVGSRSIRYLVIDVRKRIQDFKLIDNGTVNYNEYNIDPSRIKTSDVDKLNMFVSKFSADLRSRSCDMSCIYGTELCRSIETLYPGKLCSSVRILSTEEEAMAAWAAGFLCQDEEKDKDVVTAIDLGNGSTEIVRAQWDGVQITDLNSTSVALGSSKLMTSYNNNNQASYMDYLEKILPPIKASIQEAGIERIHNGSVYLIGGVATKIGWLKVRKDLSDVYRPDLVNGVKVTLGVLTELFAKMDPLYRRDPQSVIKIIDPRRNSEEEAVRVLSGAPYLAALANSIHKGKEYFVSGYGVRHGMAYLLKHRLMDT